MTEKIETVDSVQIIKPNKSQMQKINEMFNIKGEKDMGENEKMSGNEVPTDDKMRAFAKALIKAEAEETEEIVRLDIEKKQAERENREGGKGSIPMTSEMLQREHGNSKKTYDSPESLAKDICDRASEGDPEAIEIKNKLWSKVIQGWKENPVLTMNKTVEHPNMIKDSLEIQNRKWRREHKGE